MSREREVKFGFNHNDGETTVHFGIAPPIASEEALDVLDYIRKYSDACTATGEIPELDPLGDTPPRHTEIVLNNFDGDLRGVLEAIKIQLVKQHYEPTVDILPKLIRPDLSIEIDAYFREGAIR